MKLEIPDDIVRRAEVGARDLRLALAIQLYADNRIDFGDAAVLAGLTSGAFQQELLARGLSAQIYAVPQASRLRKTAG